ncbi:hypothetical protein LBMAG53_31790 [Planctomycetota bacterium]|nr:hypothetical protein LBMAG53_31790 [Planctomycetota bacterium]
MNPRPSDPDLEVVFPAQDQLGEGPVWSQRERRLCWVDLLAGVIHRSDPATRSDATFQLPYSVGAIVERSAGGLAMATAQGFAGFDPATGALEAWCHPEAAIPSNRFNDGKVAPDGSFWAGTMSAGATQPPVGALYRLDRDHRVTRLLDGVSVSNGLAWSADAKTFYFIDTLTERIDAFTVDHDAAALRERRLAVAVDHREHGWLDGMCIDAEGMLWVAHCGGWRVNRFDPRNGRLLRTVHLPVSLVTSCAFGGERLDRLYITTGRLGLDAGQLAEQPLAGALFCLHTGPIGLPSTPFAG